MDTLTVNLDGIATEIRRLKIDLKQLILDGLEGSGLSLSR